MALPVFLPAGPQFTQGPFGPGAVPPGPGGMMPPGPPLPGLPGGVVGAGPPPEGGLYGPSPVSTAAGPISPGAAAGARGVKGLLAKLSKFLTKHKGAGIGVLAGFIVFDAVMRLFAQSHARQMGMLQIQTQMASQPSPEAQALSAMLPNVMGQNQALFRAIMGQTGPMGQGLAAAGPAPAQGPPPSPPKRVRY